MQLEDELAATGLAHTVLRPGFIYGAEAWTSLTGTWFASAEAGEAVFSGDPEKRWSWIHVDDLADAYVAVVERTHAANGEVFVIADDHRPTLLDVQTGCLRAAGYEGAMVFGSAESGGVLHMSADQDELVTSAKARQVLGWNPVRPGIHEDATGYYAQWRAGREDRR